MMHVKVKAKDVRFTIPIPYAILSIVISILSSNFFQLHANKWTKHHFERRELDFTFPLLDKKKLTPIVKELKNHKGIVLVDVNAKDGTEVKVRLYFFVEYTDHWLAFQRNCRISRYTTKKTVIDIKLCNFKRSIKLNPVLNIGRG